MNLKFNTLAKLTAEESAPAIYEGAAEDANTCYAKIQEAEAALHEVVVLASRPELLKKVKGAKELYEAVEKTAKQVSSLHELIGRVQQNIRVIQG